jgi:transposase-like protein
LKSQIPRKVIESIQRHKGSGLTVAEVARIHGVSGSSVFRFWKDDFNLDKPRPARRESRYRSSRIGNKYIIDNQTDLTLAQCAEIIASYHASDNKRIAIVNGYKIHHRINNRSDTYLIDYS